MRKRMCVCVCVCVYLGQFSVQQKLTEHCKSTIIEKIKILKKETPPPQKKTTLVQVLCKCKVNDTSKVLKEFPECRERERKKKKRPQ